MVFFLAVARGGEGAHRLGHVRGLYEDALPLSDFVRDRLEHEIDVSLLGGAASVERYRYGVPDMGFSGAVDLIEQIGEALSDDLGQGFADGLADDLFFPDKVEVSRVGDVEDMVGTPKDGGRARGLPKHHRQAGRLPWRR